ncbi:MAG: hypothetical protein K9G70_02880 [Prolixibacteraceae bacterium]|nr:hypothetical protein [Prolixibacteraceae bacterium]
MYTKLQFLSILFLSVSLASTLSLVNAQPDSTFQFNKTIIIKVIIIILRLSL